jgi:hypothetical protein
MNFDRMTEDQLLGYFRDFYKDFYGVRPTFYTVEQAANRAFLLDEIQKLENAFENMAKTAQGRAALESNGWVLA